MSRACYLLAIASALASCAAPLVWQPRTPESVAAGRVGRALEHCLHEANGWPEYVSACSHEAAAACLRAGLSRQCGSIAMWWRYVGRERTGLPGSVPHIVDPPADQT